MSNVIQVCAVADYIEISKLKYHPKNPRTIKADRLEELKDSITEKGFYQPILVWKKKNIVLAGNHRLMAATELIEAGWEFQTPDGKKNMLPVVIEDVSEQRAQEILFESNNTYAEWVEDKLRVAIEEAEAAGSKVSSFGFTTDEVDKMMANAIKDAEKATKKISDDMEEDEDASAFLDRELAKDEEGFESLILPKSVYPSMKTLLSDVARALAPEWTDADGFKEAALALVKAAKELKLVKHVEISSEYPEGTEIDADAVRISEEDDAANQLDDDESAEGGNVGTTKKAASKKAKSVKTSKKAKSAKPKAKKTTK